MTDREGLYILTAIDFALVFTVAVLWFKLVNQRTALRMTEHERDYLQGQGNRPHEPADDSQWPGCHGH
jgi:hypothetical protein